MSVTVTYLDPASIDHFASVFTLCPQDDLTEELLDAVDALEPRLRDVITELFWGRMSRRAYGRAHGLSRSGVDRLVDEAFVVLKEALL